MSTQYRYYSNLSQGTFITNIGGIDADDTVVTVQATASWPTSKPFTVRFEPGTANEEVGYVSAGSGTAGDPFEITRGYDGTNQIPHSQGTAIVPGFCQADFAEPQQHMNQVTSTSGAHGLPSNAWGGGTTQLIGTYPYTAAVGTTFTIPTIPSTYNTLRIEYALRGNGTSSGGIAGAAYADALLMTFNGNTGANYQGTALVTNESAATAYTRQSNQPAFWCGCAWIQHSATAGMGRGWIEIPSYSDNSSVKSAHFMGVAADGGSGIVIVSGAGSAGPNTNTLPITSLGIRIASSSTGYIAGTVWLYGIT